MKDEDAIRGIEEVEEDYSALNKDRLVLFAVEFLHSKKIEPTFDKVVAATFKLFPKKFALIGFPEYPDGRTIYYCVYNHCTLTNKWLIGSVQSGFKVTDKGGYYLEETKKMLEGKILVRKKSSAVPKRKEVTFLKELETTTAYKKYARKGELDEADYYTALKAPIGNKELATAHLEKFLEYAVRVNNVKMISFLKEIKKYFGAI